MKIPKLKIYTNEGTEQNSRGKEKCRGAFGVVAQYYANFCSLKLCYLA
jgi:hypothetical protein